MTHFTSGELEVMQILWAHGELKPAEIQEYFAREIKNPALRSVLKILVEKGHVSRRPVGKAYFYRARTRRKSAFHSMLRDLTEQFCEGSTRTLIFNLVQSERLSDEDLAELKRIANGGSTNPRREDR